MKTLTEMVFEEISRPSNVSAYERATRFIKAWNRLIYPKVVNGLLQAAIFATANDIDSKNNIWSDGGGI